MYTAPNTKTSEGVGDSSTFATALPCSIPAISESFNPIFCLKNVYSCSVFCEPQATAHARSRRVGRTQFSMSHLIIPSAWSLFQLMVSLWRLGEETSQAHLSAR